LHERHQSLLQLMLLQCCWRCWCDSPNRWPSADTSFKLSAYYADHRLRDKM